MKDAWRLGMSDDDLDRLVATADDFLTAEFPGKKRGELRYAKKKWTSLFVKSDEPKVTVDNLIRGAKSKKEQSDLRDRESLLLDEINKLRKEKDTILKLSGTVQEIKIEKKADEKKIVGIPFIIASDWHVEETVVPEVVNHLNSFNLDIADKRIHNFFQNSLKLLSIHEKEIKFDTVVFALLGDFISGNIHEELMENCSLRPADAILWVMQRIDAGIKFFLDNTNYKFIIPCHVGNHTRITHQVHVSTESGNSLETIMYGFLLKKYEKEKRITFIIAEGYHTYLEMFGYTIRLHHGHALKYGGGIGGIFIPAYKAISQWNKSRTVSLDIFGHFHQLKNGGNFISNGSLIGYAPYALRIKADFEKPRQKFFIFTSTGEVIAEHPIFL